MEIEKNNREIFLVDIKTKVEFFEQNKSGEAKEVLSTLDIGYLITYSTKSPEEHLVNEDNKQEIQEKLKSFFIYNGAYTVHPYLRAFVDDICRKMGFNFPITLPLLEIKISGYSLQEDEKEEKRGV